MTGESHKNLQFDYISAFPIPVTVMPTRLKELLTPVGFEPEQYIDVGCMLEHDFHGTQRECIKSMMIVVPGDDNVPIELPRETGEGVVDGSTSYPESCGCIADYIPSVSGYDYIVASWSDGSFFTYNLAEKVWMSLGLTPRCEGNDRQRIIYDDLSAPVVNVAEGEISSSYHWNLQKNINWKMRNEYLRRYLWMRGARGVRVFFYEALLEDSPELHSLMDGESHIYKEPTDGILWYNLDIREFKGKILIQVWASVKALAPELCPLQTADGIVWKGMAHPMTHKLADSLIHYADANLVYLDDSFLQRYEQSDFFDCIPFQQGNFCYCNPSYKGQWGYNECRRIGRNLIQIPIRELYKNVPDREILHAYKYSIDPSALSSIDLSEEHIIGKVQRFVDVLLRLGCDFAKLGGIVGLQLAPAEWVRINSITLDAEGWRAYPVFCRLSQVVPLDMSQQDFLSRCKILHEIIVSSIPSGHLRTLLTHAGCKSESLKEYKNLKLIQALLNIIEPLNEQSEKAEAFASKNEPDCFQARNKRIAMLFLNNDLRNADAHEKSHMWITTLQGLGFDTASLNAGYGKAFEFMLDGVIESLDIVATQIERLLSTGRRNHR